MPKVISYIALHYGAEYLAYAIKSIEAVSERILIFYTATPSYGFGTHAHCPESEQELKDIALGASPKVEWHNITVGTEGEHRNYIYNFSDGYDLVLAIDADEVFEPADLPNALDLAMKTDKRYIGLGGYINFWKSFNHACHDGFTPIRITNLHNSGGEGIVPCRVYHFSTAQSLEVIKYKLLVHGHKDEIRPDWFSIYCNWKPGDIVENGLHLVAYGIWEATPFDKEQLPDILKAHLNFGKEIIL